MPPSSTSSGDTHVPEAPGDVVRLAQERADARASRDFSAADTLRDRIAEAGWTVIDEPGGYRLEAATEEAEPVARLRASDVPSVLEDEPDVDATVHWVCEGWPEDIERAIVGFRANEGDRSVQYVVADTTDRDPAAWGDDVEVVWLEEGTGWGAARNAGLKRTRGRTVLVLDGSVEPTGDVFGPLESALADQSVGVCGPYGIVTHDLRQFDEASAGDVDAIEGYLMAMRRETMIAAGLFDEKFRWYRTADIEYSFRVRDLDRRATVVDLPVTKHEHRMWFTHRARGPSEMVEEELLPVPRQVPRPLGPVG